MSIADLKTFSLLSFDVYGTLMDWETGLHTAALPLLTQLPTPLPRTEFLKIYAELEHAEQTATPALKYSSLLSAVYLKLASKLSLPAPSQEDVAAFGASVKNWPAFPDTAPALQKLRKYYKLVVLSNVDEASFRTSLPRLGGEDTFDAVLTAERIGSYKPDLRNFEYLLGEVKERFGVGKEGVLHTAQSLFHDHVPAENMGIRSAWISRGDATIGVEEGIKGYEWRWDTLGEMADAVEKAFEEA